MRRSCSLKPFQGMCTQRPDTCPKALPGGSSRRARQWYGAERQTGDVLADGHARGAHVGPTTCAADRVCAAERNAHRSDLPLHAYRPSGMRPTMCSWKAVRASDDPSIAMGVEPFVRNWRWSKGSPAPPLPS